MLSSLFALFAFVVSVVTPPAKVTKQDPVKVWMEGPVVMAMFDDGSFASGMMEEGVLIVSTADARVPQSPSGSVPTITTSYQDKNGATHTVSTPITSTTPAGLQSAKQTHQALVTMMQQLYPPKVTGT